MLPRITPNIAFHPQAGDDPLGDYLRSLDKLGTYDARGAARPRAAFRQPARPPRELQEHHELRFREVVAAIRDGYSTAWEITPRMEWSRPWDDVDKFTRRAAIGEALAHLRTLEVRGVVREIFGEPSRWELVDN